MPILPQSGDRPGTRRDDTVVLAPTRQARNRGRTENLSGPPRRTQGNTLLCVANSYRQILAVPGSASFVMAGFVGRLPISMVSLGIVLLVVARTGSYALAGFMSAAYALAAAFLGPFGARFIDRHGQHRIVPVLAISQIVFLLAFVAASSLGLPVVLQFLLLVLSGGTSPNVGSLVRARWAYALRGDISVRTAFALEAIVDEIVFIAGPPLVTVVALQISEPAALALCAVLIAIGTIWLALLRSSQPHPTGKLPIGSAGRVLSAGMAAVVATMALMGAIFGCFEVTTVAYAQEADAADLTGWLLALYATGSLLSGVVVGAVQFSRPTAVQLPVFATALAVVALPLPFVPNTGVLALTIFIAGMAVSPVLISCATLVEELVPTARLTEAMTLTISGIAVGLALGSTLSGFLVDTAGAKHGYWVMTLSSLLAAALTWLVRGPLIRATFRAGSSERPV